MALFSENVFNAVKLCSTLFGYEILTIWKEVFIKFVTCLSAFYKLRKNLRQPNFSNKHKYL